MSAAFRHAERDRTIVFGRGALASAQDLLPEAFTLVTTRRAAAGVPELADRATGIIEVRAGAVDALAADLRAQAAGRPLVALGGGRVIDTAKAIAAAEGIDDVIAIPTSLSGAELTRVHRHARGVPDDVPKARPSVVIDDPALSAGLPLDGLAAGSANALAHAVTAALSVRSSPIASTVARDAIRRMGHAWGSPEVDRDEVALAALLAAWSVDLSGLGPHHALAQTVVRTGSVEHAHANAALLPFTVRAFRTRAGELLSAIDRELGQALELLADDLRTRAGATGLGELGTDDALLDATVATAARRGELQRVPPPMDAEEIRSIYLAAAAPSDVASTTTPGEGS